MTGTQCTRWQACHLPTHAFKSYFTIGIGTGLARQCSGMGLNSGGTHGGVARAPQPHLQLFALHHFQGRRQLSVDQQDGALPAIGRCHAQRHVPAHGGKT